MRGYAVPTTMALLLCACSSASSGGAKIADPSVIADPPVITEGPVFLVGDGEVQTELVRVPSEASGEDLRAVKKPSRVYWFFGGR